MGILAKIVLALEKLAIVFSCAVTSVIVLLLIGLGVIGWQVWMQLPQVQLPESPQALKDDVACKTIADLDQMIDDLDRAVIVRTIHIDQQIPVVFDLPLDKNITVELTQEVALNNRPTTMNLPGQGGTINGWVNLTLPRGYRLPIHLTLTVPVSQSLPVQMDVPVQIPLKETDLGPVTGKLKELVKPYTLYLNEALKCSSP